MAGSKQRLRVGILIDAYETPAWSHRIVEQVIRLPQVDIAALILNDRFQSDPGQEDRYGRARNRHGGLGLFSRLKRKLVRYPDPTAKADIRSLFTCRPTSFSIRPCLSRGRHEIASGDMDAVAAIHADLLIRFGFRKFYGRILALCPYGIWYFSEPQRIRVETPRTHSQKYHRPAWIGVSRLRMQNTRAPAGATLSQSFTVPESPACWPPHWVDLWKNAVLLPRELDVLSVSGPDRFFSRVRKRNDLPDDPAISSRRVPNRADSIRYRIGHAADYFSHKWNRFRYTERWSLLFRKEKIPSWQHLGGFRRLVPPDGLLWADPFVVFRNRRHYVFFEEAPLATEKGHIAVMYLDGQHRWSRPQIVLKRSHHLSYPFVFRFQGTDYMIPESEQSRTIDVYRCVEFPNRWEFHTRLMKNVRAVDTTLLQYEGRWWLFCNMADDRTVSLRDELYLFYADTPLTSNWRAHPCNPVVSDVRRSRPAGRIFTDQEMIYRPAQNSARGYGYGLSINRIRILTEQQYREEEVARVLPGENKLWKGIHTFNAQDGLTMMDVKHRVPKR